MAGFVAKGRCRVSRRRAETGGLRALPRADRGRAVGNRCPEWDSGFKRFASTQSLSIASCMSRDSKRRSTCSTRLKRKHEKQARTTFELARSRLRELLNARRAAGKTRKRK